MLNASFQNYHQQVYSARFQRKPQKLTKSSPSIGQYVATIKLTVKISSIFVAFLENMKFKCLWTQVISKIITKVVSHPTDFKIERQEVI